TNHGPTIKSRAETGVANSVPHGSVSGVGFLPGVCPRKQDDCVPAGGFLEAVGWMKRPAVARWPTDEMPRARTESARWLQDANPPPLTDVVSAGGGGRRRELGHRRLLDLFLVGDRQSLGDRLHR